MFDQKDYLNDFWQTVIDRAHNRPHRGAFE